MYDLGIKTSLLVTDLGELAIVDSLDSNDSFKLLSANLGRILNEKINSSSSVYELGDFNSSGAAENYAKQPSISGNNSIVIMRYTVSSSNKSGIIILQVGDYRTVLYLIWDASIYTRHIWFTNNSRTVINTGYNNNWWKMGATHIKYDSVNRRIGLENIGNGMMNPNNTAVLPLASNTEDGLMSSLYVLIIDLLVNEILDLKLLINNIQTTIVLPDLDSVKVELNKLFL